MNTCPVPPVNPNCADPAYRAANPDECQYYPVLSIEPEYLLAESGHVVTYTVKLRANAIEQVLTQGLEFTSSNFGVATMDPDGNATGVAPGIATISVTWQDLSAQAQLEVVGSCEDISLNLIVMIDKSKSMNQLFSTSYATKLTFSKQIASDFIDTINLDRDQVAVWTLGNSGEEKQGFTAIAADAKSAINSIAITTEKTNLADAMTDAIAAFPSSGVRVLVLFTDGEYTDSDPKAVAEAFRDSGGVICVVATHAWGQPFQDIAEISSAGFLISAYGGTETSVLDNLAGLKNFICGTGCGKTSSVSPMAQLDYNEFINWDVIEGTVDLCGLGLWDVLGNDANQGLYVDMVGTDPGTNGTIRSKDGYEFEAGKEYRFTIKVAYYLPVPGVLMSLDVNIGLDLDENITAQTPRLLLVPSVFEWIPTTTHTGKITIKMKGGLPRIGLIIDDILLENVTDDVVMLEDDFNSENPTVVEGSPSYYGICLPNSPGQQFASPTPPVPRVVE